MREQTARCRVTARRLEEVLGGMGAAARVRRQALLPRAAAQFNVRLFIAMRTTTRILEAAIAVQAHRDWLVAVAVACVLADLRMSAWTRAPIRGPLGLLRLGLDAADTALWAWGLLGSSATTAIVLVPLASEAGLQVGIAGIAVALAGCSAALPILALTHTPVTWMIYLWPTAAVFTGILGGAYMRVRHRAHEQEAEWRIEAATVRAEAAGRDSVAGQSDAVIDVLARAHPLIRAHEPDPPAFPTVASAARGIARRGARAVYLPEAFREWQLARNNASAALADDVEVRLGLNAGTLLLSAPQESRLISAISRMGLRGEVFLDAESPGPVGTAQVVLVNRQRVRLPADPAPLSQVIHPAPMAFLWGAVTVLFQSLPAWEAVPFTVTALLAALFSAAGWWAHARIARRGSISPRAILIAALLLGALQAVLTSALARPGSDRLPFLFFLPWVAPLLGFYLRDLPVAGRWLVLGGCALASALGCLAWPDQLMPSSVPLALLWPLAGAVAVSGLRSALDADLAELRDSFERRYSEAVDAAFRRGRDHVIEITSSAVTEINWRFAAASLPAAEEAEVGRRLAKATDLLAGLIQAVDSRR